MHVINMSTILYVALMKLHVCYIRIVLMCVQVMHACDKHEHYPICSTHEASCVLYKDSAHVCAGHACMCINMSTIYTLM